MAVAETAVAEADLAAEVAEVEDNIPIIFIQ